MGAKRDNSQWKGKLSAGVLAGGGLAIAGMAVVGQMCRTTGSPMTLSAQALLWGVVVAWIVPVCACFLFSSGRRAWAWLGGGCAVLWLLFLILKHAIR